MTRLERRGLNETLSPSRRRFLIGMAGACCAFGFATAEAASYFSRRRAERLRADHLVQHRSRWHRQRQHHPRRDGSACRHCARAHSRR